MTGKKLVSYSKQLRIKQTPWERKLWYHLRGKSFNGLKFKRQVPIGKFIVDFCCDRIKLVIELDGGYHNNVLNRQLDYMKEGYLKREGYKVLRFWNNQIDLSLEEVLEKINIATTSLPASPHAWGEESKMNIL